MWRRTHTTETTSAPLPGDDYFMKPLLFSLLAGLSTAVGGSVIFFLPGHTHFDHYPATPHHGNRRRRRRRPRPPGP